MPSTVAKRDNAGRTASLEFTVLHPPASDYERRRTTNAMSCAVLVVAGSHHVLLTGDIGIAEEAAILARWPGLAAHWLAAPHHGSRSSSSPALLAAIRAREAAAQAGYRNRYGHPDAGVVGRYAEPASRCAEPITRAHCSGACGRTASPRHSAWRTEGVRYWHNRPGAGRR